MSGIFRPNGEGAHRMEGEGGGGEEGGGDKSQQQNFCPPLKKTKGMLNLFFFIGLVVSSR